jgi:hypothetical protein
VTGLWFSPVSSTNKIDCHNITEILLKVELNTITLTLTHGFDAILNLLFCFFLFEKQEATRLVLQFTIPQESYDPEKTKDSFLNSENPVQNSRKHGKLITKLSH